MVHWETSQKPLFIRTVWVDGHRHAILSDDDPAAALTPSGAPLTSRGSRASSPASPSSASPSPAPQETLVLNATAHQLNLNIPSKQTFSKNHCSRDIYRIDRNSPTNQKQDTDRNSLSERVLQWLDLAGRSNLKADPNESRLNTSRRSVPEVRSSAKGYFNDFSKNNTSKSARRKTARKSYPQKCYVTDTEEDQIYNDGDSNEGSLASSNIQNYVKTSYRNDKGISETYHGSRTVLPSNIITFQESSLRIGKSGSNANGQSSKNKNKKALASTSLSLSSGFESDEDDTASDSHNTSRRKTSVQMESFEWDYIDIIRKKIVETTFNVKAARRQLHIFIPSIPKKIGESKASSVVTNKDIT